LPQGRYCAGPLLQLEQRVSRSGQEALGWGHSSLSHQRRSSIYALSDPSLEGGGGGLDIREPVAQKKLVTNILDSAHTFKGDKTWGWVADLLDNKIVVAKKFSIDMGLNYNTPEESITKGMAIASAITATDTSAAVTLIGVTEANFLLV